MKIQVLLSADSLLEIMADRQEFRSKVDYIERELDLGEIDFFMTEPSVKRVLATILTSTDNEEDEDIITQGILNLVEILHVSPDQLHQARNLNLKSIESALEVVCAVESKMNGIVTHEPDKFDGMKNDYYTEILTPKDLKTKKDNLNTCQLNFVFDDLLPTLSITKIHWSFTVLAEMLCCGSSESEKYLKQELDKLVNESKLCVNEDGRYTLTRNTECYTRAKLENDLDLKHTIIRKIIEYYINFSKRYGGLDWGFYQERYDFIDDEWTNIKLVLQLCYERHMYKDIEILWQELNHFADLYSYHDDRILWLKRLVKIASQNKNDDMLTLQLARQAWTYIIRDTKESLQQAKVIIDKLYRHFNGSKIGTKYYATHVNFIYHMHIKDYENSKKILRLQLKLLRVLKRSNCEERVFLRQSINFFRNRAKLPLVLGDLKTAKERFESTREMALKIGWVRGVSYTLNKLANIAIDENNFELAKEYLDQGFTIAKRNKNWRRMGGFKTSYAVLAYCQGDEELTEKYIKEAQICHNTTGQIERANNLVKTVLEHAEHTGHPIINDTHSKKNTVWS
jgi:hypothetical protein